MHMNQYESIVASECNYFHFFCGQFIKTRLPGFPQHGQHFARHHRSRRWCHVADVHGARLAGGQLRDEAGDVVSILDLGATWRNLARFRQTPVLQSQRILLVLEYLPTGRPPVCNFLNTPNVGKYSSTMDPQGKVDTKIQKHAQNIA